MKHSATKKYLDLMREQYPGISDYRIAKKLHVSKGCVSRWSNDKGGMDDEPAAILADLLDLDPVEVLTEIYRDRAKSLVARQYFDEVLVRAKSAQAIVAVAVLGVLPFLPVEQLTV